MPSTLTFLTEQSFMPHGHCYLWNPTLLWIQLVSNVLIGLAYVAISSCLGLFVWRLKDLPLRWVYIAFGVFIVSCGLTHFMDAVVIWYPRYWLDAAVRIVTAIASVGTALLLPRLGTRAMQLSKGAMVFRERGIALESAVTDLEQLYKKTLQLDQLKTTFFANVSHELRTPLTLVLGPVEHLLSDERLDPEHRRELELVARNARSLLRHVNNLLDIAKLDAGKLEPHYAAVDLAELVRLTASSFESLARERNIALSIITPPKLPGELDVEKTQRVVLNLLSNAFKFTPPGGYVRVELGSVRGSEDAQRCARMVVADSGPGVPQAERTEIFERFRQGGTSVMQQVGGTGLGLSIVHEFVTLQGGEVSVREAPEGGAAFHVSLPLLAPKHARLHKEVGISTLATQAASTVQDLRQFPSEPDDQLTRTDVPLILLVEDNTDMRALLVRTLRRHYRVVQARDGAEGLELAQQTRPDLIVSDLMMPRLSGEQLLSAVRERPELRDVPVLLLTAKTDEALKVRSLQNGAQDYVVKPFFADELLARIANLLTIKRTRDLLLHEVEAQQGDVEALSRQLVAQKRELAAALEVAREARQQAEQASRAKGDFLSLVSHELRTPLTAIQLQLERMRRGVTGALTDKQLQVLEKMARSSARLLDLLDALLEFSRIESGRLTVSLQHVDLSALVREAIDELRPRAEQKNIALRLECTAEHAALRTDPRLVRLIVVNLVDNAIKYTEAGTIDVRLDVLQGGAVRVCVSDTGPGIDPAMQERIFEPFQQLEPVRHKRGAGVGLGLALVKSIARALDADVAIDSQIGRGSAFTVTLSPA